MKICLVTNDTEEIARELAYRAKFIDKDENENMTRFFYTGDRFQEVVEEIVKNTHYYLKSRQTLDEETKKWMRKRYLDQVYVLAECKPHQKELFVKVQQDLGQSVAVAINNMSDYPALKQADVSISAKASCDVIKQNSSVLLEEFEFEQFEASLMMGKQVYKNIQKYMTF